MGRFPGTLALLLCMIPASWPGNAAIAPSAATRPRTVTAGWLDPANNGRLAFRITRNRDGLPQNGINALAFDAKGYLWVGTQDGAARFDGRTWSILNMPNRAVSNHVRVISACGEGGLWFGTREGGLACWKDNQWIQFNTSNGLPSNGIRALLETHSPDGRSFLWAGTDAGLARYDGASWSPTLVAAGNPSPRVNCLLETGAGTNENAVWVGTDTGLARLQGGVWTLYTTDAGLPNAVVNCLLERVLPSGERLLVAGTNSGLAEFRGTRWQPSALEGKTIRSLAETVAPSGARSLWVGIFKFPLIESI